MNGLECGFVLFYFHHDMMNVDQFTSTCQPTERWLGQDLLKAMVVLYHL